MTRTGQPGDRHAKSATAESADLTDHPIDGRPNERDRLRLGRLRGGRRGLADMRLWLPQKTLR